MQDKIFHGLKLLKCCGKGAYGEVHYCEDISGKKMAVKIVSKEEIGAHWKRELKGVINYRKITENAPGLLRIYHVEEDEKSFFYTMEAADSAGEAEYTPDTLAYRLKSGAIPQADLFRILSGIFDGIKLLHRHSFAHRDIKPDNILFVDGVPKLADIGLVSNLAQTMTVISGTLLYLPPEVRAADSPVSLDEFSRRRCDLYAFGKVIYCAVTGADVAKYPSCPENWSLKDPVQKYFYRLSLQLCEIKPDKRLSSVDVLDGKFAEIKRKLECGENFTDRIKYGAELVWKQIKNFCIRYRLLLLILALLIGGLIYIQRQSEPTPPPPTPETADPKKDETKKDDQKKDETKKDDPETVEIPIDLLMSVKEKLSGFNVKTHDLPVPGGEIFNENNELLRQKFIDVIKPEFNDKEPEISVHKPWQSYNCKYIEAKSNETCAGGLVYVYQGKTQCLTFVCSSAKYTIAKNILFNLFHTILQVKK